MLFLPVDKNQIPVTMNVFVEDVQYTFTFNYNATYDFFTIDLASAIEPIQNEIIIGEKLILQKPLFTTRDIPFKNTLFIPMDISRLQPRITWDNFGNDVLIYVLSRGSAGEPFE